MASSVTESFPDAGPFVVGLNDTWIWQLLPGGSLDGQLFVWPKVALAEIFEMIVTTEPVLDNVVVCAELSVPISWTGNVNLDGVSETVAAGIPVPLKDTNCGLPTPL
jgi:hypothetical protein